MQRLAVAVVLTTLACTRVNPAFDSTSGLDETTKTGGLDGDTGAEVGSTGAEDGGDGDLGDGDGDHDGGDGDGDGEGDTGDGDSGDGDGDTDTGDGDGDTGDGDGDTGDGDGDPACNPEPDGQEHLPFLIASLGWIETSTAPNFAFALENCHLMVVCAAEALECDGEAPYLAKVYSSGNVFAGAGLPEDSALQIRFQSGGGECGANDALELDPSQSIGLSYWNGQAEALLEVRMPCLEEYDVPVYVDTFGSTFWDPALSDPAALWP
jgi:hypothetical protein